MLDGYFMHHGNNAEGITANRFILLSKSGVDNLSNMYTFRRSQHVLLRFFRIFHGDAAEAFTVRLLNLPECHLRTNIDEVCVRA